MYITMRANIVLNVLGKNKKGSSYSVCGFKANQRLHQKERHPLRFANGVLVIPLGFEPKTHALEGRCSNPTELRNHFL